MTITAIARGVSIGMRIALTILWRRECLKMGQSRNGALLDEIEAMATSGQAQSDLAWRLLS